MSKNGTTTVTYKLADGTIVNVDVSSEVANVLQETNRKEDALRKQDERHKVPYGYLEGITELRAFLAPEGLEDMAEKSELAQLLHEAIKKLPQLQRRRVVLHFFHGLTRREIARMEGVHAANITRRINSALTQIKKTLET